MNNDNIQTSANFPIVDPSKESIKLIKNTKGYGWEVKVLGDILNEDVKNRLTEINDWLRESYGISESDE